MKVVNKLAVLLSLGAFVSIASAKTTEQTYLETCRKDPGIPVPVVVVTPRVQSEYAGTSVSVEFTVSATGKPSDFSVLSAHDNALADTVVQALKQWQFTPAQRGGVAVSTKVVLPIHVVDATGEESRFIVD